MKTVQKALEILEFVSISNGQAVPPSLAAEKLDINPSGCVRLMQSLCKKGYLMQVSRREGYVIGPNALTFSCRNSIYKNLVDKSKSRIIELSEQFKTMVNLSVMHQNQRYVIFHHGHILAVPTSGVANYSRSWNYAENATERLLLAAASNAERKQLVNLIGVPESFASCDAFFQELDQLQKNGCVKFYSKLQNLWIIGGLLMTAKYPVAAIGLSTQSEEDACLAEDAVKQTCAAIRKDLQSTFFFA